MIGFMHIRIYLKTTIWAQELVLYSVPFPKAYIQASTCHDGIKSFAILSSERSSSTDFQENLIPWSHLKYY